VIRKRIFFALSLLLLLGGSHLAPLSGQSTQLPRTIAALVPGPDVIVGDLPGLQQSGTNGTQVGLSLPTISCNRGDQPINWMAFPSTSHPFTPENLYRMSGGSNNDERFEQIGQSWLKHGLQTSEEDTCSFGCVATGSLSLLGPGCSDTYSATLNGNPNFLGSRAWANPFTGVFPANANNHAGHTHTGTSHRLFVESSDLDTTANAGATYYAEAQYVTADEYNWCQSHPGQCNMYNNASYRRFNVTGTAPPFTFLPVGATVQMVPAINAWTGATINPIEPEPGVDGRAFIAYKVTNPSAGVWHYEYALYNQNLDRAIQSLSVPLGCGVTVSNPGFHAPPVQPGFPNDGTVGDTGFSGTPWSVNQTASELSWSSETFAQNPNANALRFGTLYNFRFDSDRPPQVMNATIAFFKTGSPVTVAIKGPVPCSPLQIVDAVSRLTHGAAGPFDIGLPLTGEPGVECRDGGGNYNIVVTFNNTLVSGNVDLTSGNGNIAGSPAFAGNTVTIALTDVTNAQKLVLTLSGFTDNLAQVLPDTALSVNILIGDTNGNKTTNASDVAQTKAQSGLPITGNNFRTDINISGAINASDVAKSKANTGHNVP
jgi:hypothetical protein